jgi:hypothetical protein
VTGLEAVEAPPVALFSRELLEALAGGTESLPWFATVDRPGPGGVVRIETINRGLLVYVLGEAGDHAQALVGRWPD